MNIFGYLFGRYFDPFLFCSTETSRDAMLTCYINLFTHLERHNEQAKLAKIDAIGFDFLRRVPQWHVKQSIMLQLARAYDVETNTLKVDAGDIRIIAELIGNVFGIPSRG
ncbi:hypothetical protein S245_056636 [Arachis hypogaea]